MINNLSNDERFFGCANPIEPFRCLECANFHVHKWTDMKEHVKGGHRPLNLKENVYGCESCNYQTHSKYLIVRHRLLNLCLEREKVKSEESLSEEVSRCSLPDENEISLKHLRSAQGVGTSKKRYFFDLKRHLGSKLFHCEHCSFTAKLKVNLISHIVCRHTDPDEIQWFECEQCPYRAKLKSTLKHHMIHKHSNETKFKCDLCQFETKTRKSLKMHVSRKHTTPDDVKWFECEHCPYKGKIRSNLKKHMYYRHGNTTQLKCDHCQFETKYDHALEIHILTKHTADEEVQWFECAQCPYKSKIKFQLKLHMKRKHSERENLKCDHCRFETTFAQTLQTHILAEHADPNKVSWFECEKCPYKSKIKFEVKEHMVRKHGDRENLKCEHCQFETKYKQTLKTHILAKHTDPDKISWFECQYCSYKGVTRINLNKHMYYKHPSEKE